MNFIILSNVLLLGMITYINMAFLETRFNKFVYNILFFFVFFALISFVNASGASSFKAVILLSIFILYSCFVFKGNFKTILLTILPFYIIVTISEIFTSSILHLLTDFNQYTDPTSLEYLFAISISNLITFTLATLFIQMRKQFHQYPLPKYTWIVFVLPLTTILFITSVSDYYYVAENNSSLIIVLVGLLISNFVFIFVFFKVIENIHIQQNIETIKIKEELTRIRYELLDQHYKSNFQFLHDLLMNCRDINKCLDENNLDELKEKITVINETTFNEFNAIYSNSPVLNSVINNYLNILNENNIKIRTTIEYSDFSFISLYDQTELFSSLLDLGIDCCKNSKGNEGLIIIKSKEVGKQMMMQMLISSDKEYQFDISGEFLKLLKKYDVKHSTKRMNHDETISLVLIFDK